MLEVDKTTGFVEAKPATQEQGDLTQNEAVTRANIVRFIRARETLRSEGIA
ncbi:VirB8/TrbF family protein [Rhizobium beringeri]